MADADFNAGTRSQPLGDLKAGLSADLDALAAYLASLNTFASSPYRNADGSLTSDGAAGRTIFKNANCSSCHSGAAFTDSTAANLHDIGTLKPSSGQRLGGALNGIDTPTLRDAWATPPYLHDGSAATLGEAVRAHNGVNISDADLAQLTAYLQQIGGQESGAPVYTAPTIANPGNQSGRVGVAVNLAISASDADGDPLTYGASGLPAGLAIDLATGLITGTPTTIASYDTTATVSDGVTTASANFSWSIASSDVTKPSKPTSFSLTKVSGFPSLSWAASTDNVGVAGYIIYRSTNGTQGPEVMRVAATSWIDLSAKEGVTYTYAVAAYDAAGNVSARTGRKTITAYQAPSKPASLSAVLVSGKPQLTWSASTDNVGVAGYIIYRSTSNNSLGPEVARVDGATTTWRDAGAVAGVRYTYAVKAYDAAGYLSARSPYRSITSQ
jgi:mono/diheme cytochrome c family protein